MAYQLQDFMDDEVLFAAQLVLMEKGIIDAQKAAEEANKSLEEINKPAITTISVRESADGSAIITESLEDGTTNTITITADANGNPASVNGIPITWTEVSA